ncbi:hypothetical protein JZ751_018743, partial [Albula glossodonta]
MVHISPAAQDGWAQIAESQAPLDPQTGAAGPHLSHNPAQGFRNLCHPWGPPSAASRGSPYRSWYSTKTESRVAAVEDVYHPLPHTPVCGDPTLTPQYCDSLKICGGRGFPEAG